MAFRFAEIGGPAQNFLDQWTYGSLRQEMRRISELTSRFQFPEGEASLAQGWVRMANILPATLAAAFAASLAGLVSYFRSLRDAYRAARDGKAVPPPSTQDDWQWNSRWRSSQRAAASSVLWAALGAAAGLAMMLFTSWTPLGLAGWLLVGAMATLGAGLALTTAAVIALVVLFAWVGDQLS